MLTAIKIKNFKVFEETDWIPIQGNVVFIGPNNSGKTTILQALSLWHYGLQKWISQRKNSKAVSAVVMNRKDLYAIPILHSRHIWNRFFTHKSQKNTNQKSKTALFNNIEISVKGIHENKEWTCTLEFRYNSSETIYTKLIEKSLDYDVLEKIQIAFLPPMSGLKLEEEKLLFSTVEARIGEGRTAEVLGNLFYQVCYPESDVLRKNRNPEEDWKYIQQTIKEWFNVEPQKPEIDSRGAIKIKYINADKIEMEINSAGRGMQQILLLLSYLMLKPNTVFLLDEPDAHLEILKQEQIYKLLSHLAKEKKSQILIASHSEVVLNQAASNQDTVIAVLPFSKPVVMEKTSHILKSLKTIPISEYYLAQLKGWILYTEGTTDLNILIKFAEKLNHSVLPYLKNCFHKPLNTNDPNKAREHFSALQSAYPKLIGIAVYDNISNSLNTMSGLYEDMWRKREIENYFYSQDTLLKWALGKQNDLFASNNEKAIQDALDDVLTGAAKKNPKDEYWNTCKASEEIEKILRKYYENLNIYGNTSKNNFIELIDYQCEFDPEITEKLNFIYEHIPK